MIGIINYNAGNMQSVANTLEQMGIEYFIASSPVELQKAERIIFPGVGHAKSCMAELRSRGFDVFLQSTQKPVLAICVGMQLLFDFSEEGDTECLGIIAGSVKKFSQEKVSLIPHMGWNDVSFHENILFSDIPQQSDFYFVHSYYCDPTERSKTIASCNYDGFSFCCAVQKDNFYGVQFHPEKSGEMGKVLLKNFADGLV